MAEAQLQQFLEKVRQLNALVALSEANQRCGTPCGTATAITMW
jgi:hypothetical protein